MIEDLRSFIHWLFLIIIRPKVKWRIPCSGKPIRLKKSRWGEYIKTGKGVRRKKK